ncbi:PAS modulated sigma54 specific transcriptional regulator, Fis family [Pseudodesulfovibrio profundus]|uniref:PAS modulated sigma54 specific transcriptional regulator, Fis family n=1 Tax=Pseudodesulfovibrio profundus TaxID=57320 RepID=A0A2C8FE71_9BACT|nr:sigma-54-dependent Fis family transcriptional regulator [Pseudodesulfovibrio profundus]MBC16485.1 sigma-54-dependent Fis family transcriptional regulator [Desulfovibrio sp.]SOB60762.1 PAS modulated sigma54 specific transcriptional regulator, Fis family [Pseudodesulfovibrio profundus]|tara:strand:- start:30973 stop:32361 length:1389 start_codon:yes stop_codon:yes gene_type:complete
MPTVNPSLLTSLLSDLEGMNALLDELPIGVAVMDHSGKVLLVNKPYETITGLNGERAAGLHCMHALRCDYCTNGCPVLAGWAKKTSRSVDANIVSRSREKIFVRLTVAPLLDSSGQLKAIIESITPGAAHLLDETSGSVFGFGELVGRSPKIRKLFAMTPSIAQTDSPVLITGETGTGKDMLAEEIHNESDRADGPFIKVNCGALPEDLLESELFGHIKNALPGADHDKPGRLRMAHGGTLFISEIGDLPYALQSKLLSYMDDHVVHPVGSAKGVRTDVRIMAATLHNLEGMVSRNQFRQDLLYRLNVIRLQLPPLRDRGEDLLLLMDHFLKMFQVRFGKSLEGFSKNTEKLLQSYSFPGNVRELRNLVEYAVNFCDGKVIRMRHLPGYILQGPGLPEPLASAPPTGPSDIKTPPPERWEDVQRKMILDALTKSGGKKKQAAEMLGWGRSTLWRKMKHFGIE